MLSNWFWRRLLKVLWTTRSLDQSILKEINPEYSLEGLLLNLQYFGCLMGRAYALEKTLSLGKIECRRRRGWDGWIASLTQWTWVWANSRKWWGQGSLACCSPWGHKELDKTATEQQQLTTKFPRSGKFNMFTFLVFAKCKSYQMQTHPKYFST